jgi:VCBS repeat-containing protein
VGGTISATDLDGDRLVYAVMGTAPAGVTVNADGTFTVRPQASDEALGAGQTRVVNFQVAASDGLASSDPANITVTIEGANDVGIFCRYRRLLPITIAHRIYTPENSLLLFRYTKAPLG